MVKTAQTKTKLYIIHGWTYTVAPWERTIAQLEKQGITVEMLNVPGLTTSSRKVWTIEDYVNWADRKIPQGAVALGHSNGGRILLNLLTQKPNKLKQLILLDSAGVYENNSRRDLLRSLSKKLGFLKKIPGVAKVWHKLTGASDYDRAPENMKITLSNMLDSDKNLDLTKVTVPTSILWGEADTVTPPRQAGVLHRAIAGSTLKLFPGWTHAPYISHPAELAKAIVDAIKHPPKPPAITNAATKSASLALKKAPEPTLSTKSSEGSVASDVPTKLVLLKGKKLTEDIVVSDAEGAAVRYDKDLSEKPQSVTNTQAVSASFALKKSAKTTPKVASDRPQFRNQASSSQQKEVSIETSPLAELAAQSDEPVDFVPTTPTVISSATVPKVSRVERMKRKVTQRKTTGNKTSGGKK